LLVFVAVDKLASISVLTNVSVPADKLSNGTNCPSCNACCKYS
jgi:epoxyqueuosine reductase QueG